VFCKNCGKEIAADALMCPSCGPGAVNAPAVPRGLIVARRITWVSLILIVVGVLLVTIPLTRGILTAYTFIRNMSPWQSAGFFTVLFALGVYGIIRGMRGGR